MMLLVDILNAIAFFLLLLMAGAGVESLRPAYPIPLVRKKELKPEIAYFFINVLVTSSLGILLLQATLVTYVLEPYFPHAEGIGVLPFAIQLAIALLAMDFLIYARHRFTHIYLWPIHAIHHSITEINWMTKYRLHPLDIMVAQLFSITGLYFLGLQADVLMAAAGIITVMDLFNHTNLRLAFPKPLRYFLSSPDYHKWHHDARSKGMNKNFVVMFPFIDLMFRTYHHPDSLPEACGIHYRKKDIPVPETFTGQLIHPFVAVARKIRNPGNRY